MTSSTIASLELAEMKQEKDNLKEDLQTARMELANIRVEFQVGRSIASFVILTWLHCDRFYITFSVLSLNGCPIQDVAAFCRLSRFSGIWCDCALCL